MADFADTMKQWKRMCSAHGNDYGKCDNCPLGDERICAFEISDIDDDEFERIEAKVMAWAAEHPEPVYPTWREYMLRLRLGNLGFEYEDDASLLDWNIPADIAQKLGIEPKEG